VTEEPVVALEAQARKTQALLAGLSDAQAGHRYAEGKWTVRDVAGHMADAERVMSYRAMRIARGDATPLHGFDENAYVEVAGADRRPIAELAAELAAVRNATLALFRGLDAEAWRRRGAANGNPVSVRALAHIIAGHERHHVEILRTRYGIASA
jgi:DinB superfamily